MSDFLKRARQLSTRLLTAISRTFFVSNAWTGLAVIATLAIAGPHLAVAGLVVSVLARWTGERLLAAQALLDSGLIELLGDRRGSVIRNTAVDLRFKAVRRLPFLPAVRGRAMPSGRIATSAMVHSPSRSIERVFKAEAVRKEREEGTLSVLPGKSVSPPVATS